jgi:K+-sensing histidine kinase KdpD
VNLFKHPLTEPNKGVGAQGPSTPGIFDFRRVVNQMDLGIAEGADSERVLRLAGSAAAQAHGSLLVVHVADEHGPTEIQLELSADSQNMLRHLGVPNVRVVKGRVKEALIGAAQHPGADALIIGRAPNRGALGRIRDLTYGLIRDSPVPVLSV